MKQPPQPTPENVVTAVDWGHLAFIAIVAASVSWYLYDILSVSTDINNTLVVVPLAVVALVLCVILLPQCIQRPRKRLAKPIGSDGIAEMGANELRSNNLKHLISIGGLASALGAYVCLLNTIGFDVATWLFALTAMVICGERRPLPLLLYPIVSAVVLIEAFRALLPYPMYTRIL